MGAEKRKNECGEEILFFGVTVAREVWEGVPGPGVREEGRER